MKQFSWAPDLWIKQVYFWDWSQALGSVVDVEILQVEEENQRDPLRLSNAGDETGIYKEFI